MVKRDPNSLVVFRDLQEMADAILGGVGEMFKELRKEMADMKAELKGEIAEVKTEVRFLKDEVNSLKADTPTISEFKRLKERVDKYMGV